jgi:hypothetical protein
MATDSLHAAVHSGTSLSHPPCLHSPHTHAKVLVCCKRHVLGLGALMVALRYCCSFAANSVPQVGNRIDSASGRLPQRGPNVARAVHTAAS